MEQVTAESDGPGHGGYFVGSSDAASSVWLIQRFQLERHNHWPTHLSLASRQRENNPDFWGPRTNPFSALVKDQLRGDGWSQGASVLLVECLEVVKRQIERKLES